MNPQAVPWPWPGPACIAAESRQLEGLSQASLEPREPKTSTQILMIRWSVGAAAAVAAVASESDGTGPSRGVSGVASREEGRGGWEKGHITEL